MNEDLKNFLIRREVKVMGRIKWAHAVNTVKYLDQSLANYSIDFLEIDISLSESGEPIAAHYPNKSDLTFDTLLNKVKDSGKGIKLDFKDSQVIEPCGQKLKAEAIALPVILNSDILNAQDAPESVIKPEDFINTCQKYFPQGLLSLGWRTTENSIYAAKDIEAMLSACQNVDAVTFPVRASILPRSWENVKRLIERRNHTLTIWNSEPVGSSLKDWIDINTDPQKCFYDLKFL
jgi:hypothetical protein